MVVPLLGAILPAVAQQPDETPPVLSASKILPPGSFGAVQSTFAIAGGTPPCRRRIKMAVTIVILKNEGQESGTQLSLGPGGMKVTMK
jgi:hypothetical protein